MRKHRSGELPDGITRTHILQAISEYKNHGIPTGFKDSHTYCVEYDGKKYPPQAIAALAAQALTGYLPQPGFRAGKGTKCFRILSEAGFAIVRKKSNG